ncbi:MAG: PIG-L family deacetylase [Candidatus Omnitrophica bacterium]|nr:PIG-L family deacetylase [Candidatus Omnitrophota bacterium]
MNILAIGAHPDDIEYGCGGLLLKAAEKGNKIYLFILTRGERGGDPKIREKEQEKAARLLGAERLLWGDFSDTQLPGTNILIPKIEEVLNLVNPEEVYVNYFDDTHQDHRVLSDAAISATRYIKNVFFYEDYTTTNFEPNLFVEIEGTLNKKIELLKCHHSQMTRVYPTGLDILESVRAIANFRGFQGKVKYAEGFKALRFLREV